jgi:hypothetical protein
VVVSVPTFPVNRGKQSIYDGLVDADDTSYSNLFSSPQDRGFLNEERKGPFDDGSDPGIKFLSFT